MVVDGGRGWRPALAFKPQPRGIPWPIRQGMGFFRACYMPPDEPKGEPLARHHAISRKVKL